MIIHPWNAVHKKPNRIHWRLKYTVRLLHWDTGWSVNTIVGMLVSLIFDHLRCAVCITIRQKLKSPYCFIVYTRPRTNLLLFFFSLTFKHCLHLFLFLSVLFAVILESAHKDRGTIHPQWLLWLAVALGILFLIMLIINIFLCSAMSCSCARTEIIEKEPSIIEDYDPYRSWPGSQYGSRLESDIYLTNNSNLL